MVFASMIHVPKSRGGFATPRSDTWWDRYRYHFVLVGLMVVAGASWIALALIIASILKG